MTVNVQKSVFTIEEAVRNNIPLDIPLGMQLYCDAAHISIEEATGNTIQSDARSAMHLYFDAEQTSFEEVAGICPNKDDPNMSSLTIRSLIIGLIFVLSMSFYHMWSSVTNLYAVIPPVIVLLLAHPIGKIWARIDGGPWTIKEHSIVLIMSNIAWKFAIVYNFSTISFLQYQEKRAPSDFVRVFFFVVTIQFLGFGLAGILRYFLVWPSSEIWPSNFPLIALLRVLHENRDAAHVNMFGGHEQLSLWKKFLSNQRLFYFVIVIAQFIFYWLPGYIMPVLGAFSWICMIKPNNYILAQLTDFRGLSLGSLSFDWYSLTYFFNSPLVVPRWALVNIAVGFVLIAWVITPIVYFCDVWGTHNNLIGSGTQSPSDWSAVGLITTFTAFASLSAVLVHMFLHHSKNLWTQLRSRTLRKKGNDIHCRLISFYPDVPDWWFVIVSLIAVIVLMIVAQLSQLLVWYNVLFALIVPTFFVLPFGMVSSITGQLIQNQGVYYLMVIIVGALWAGDQPKMMSFVAIGYTAYCQTLYLVSNMKLGHYMKIPPRILFFVQALACLACSSFSAGIQYYFYAGQHYYEKQGAFVSQSAFDLTNVGSALHNNTSFLDSSTSRNRYFLWSLLVGAVLPVPFWLASRRYKWCHLVHIPLVLAAVSWMPLVDVGTLLTWLVIGLVISYFFRKKCWKRYIYLTSAALDTGLYLCLAIIGGPLIYYNIRFPTWWGTGGPTGSGCPFSKPNAALQQIFNPETYVT